MPRILAMEISHLTPSAERSILPDGSVTTRYFHTDNLGSIAVITDESGTVVERDSYDAWGQRRLPTGADGTPPASQTTLGFTGQEELDFGLVHLNGRVYDPLVGRMMSADPYVPDPLNGQAWNPYSYVINNPLAFTDPSGYSWLSTFLDHSFGVLFRKFPILGDLFEIASVALCFGNPVCIIPTAFASTAFVAGVTSGNLGYALRAGLIAGVTAIVGSAVGSIPLGGIDGAYALGDFQELYGPGYNQATDNFEAPPPWPGESNQIAVAVAPAGGGSDPTAGVPSAGSGLTAGMPSVGGGTNVGPVGGALIGGAAASVNAAILGTLPYVPGGAYSRLSAANLRAGNYGYAATYFVASMLDLGMAVMTLGESSALSSATRGITEFLSNVTVVSRGRVIARGTVDLRDTLEGIQSGRLRPRDVFQNREGRLPSKPPGYYLEYQHPTPGVSDAGPQRIIWGQGGELHYTPDHYQSFIPLNP